MATFKLEDYNKLIKDVKIANQRIQRIQKRYGESSWAINELYNKIDNELVKGISSLSGNIKISRNMSEIQLRAIQKATETFLKSNTSKLRGISATIKNTKDSLQRTFGDEANRISDKEINVLYDLVEDKNKRAITEQIGASTVWAKTIQAKEQNLTFNEYESLFKDDIDIKDKDIREFLKDTYKKYKKSN